MKVLPLILLVLVIVAAAHAGGTPVPDGDVAPPATTTIVIDDPAQQVMNGALRTQLKHEHRRYLAAHMRVRQLTRTLAHRSSTREAIDLACHAYGSCTTLWRRAKCESGFSPFARNRSGASGLFQFLPSTWNTTPFSGFSIWSPYASALAAGWMNAHGRGSEWACH